MKHKNFSFDQEKNFSERIESLEKAFSFSNFLTISKPKFIEIQTKETVQYRPILITKIDEDEKKVREKIEYTKKVVNDDINHLKSESTNLANNKTISSSIIQKNNFLENINKSKFQTEDLFEDFNHQETFILNNFKSNNDNKEDNYSSVFNSLNNKIKLSSHHHNENFSNYPKFKVNFFEPENKKLLTDYEYKNTNLFSGKNIVAISNHENFSPLKSGFMKMNNLIQNSFEKSGRNSRNLNKIHTPKISPFNSIIVDKKKKKHVSKIPELNEKDTEINEYNNPFKTKKYVRKIKSLKNIKCNKELLTFEKCEKSINSKILGNLNLKLDLELDIESDEDLLGETLYINLELKQKFIKFYIYEMLKIFPELNFGENPVKHYTYLVELYKFESEKLCDPKYFFFSPDSQSIIKLEKIKESVKLISSNLHSYPIFCFPPNENKIYLNIKRKKIVKNVNKFKCLFCSESFEKSEALGGHSKLHNNFK